jgi:hypothetical protein
MPFCGELRGGRHDDLDGRLALARVGCGSPGILERPLTPTCSIKLLRVGARCEVTDGIPAAERPWVGGAGSITAMRTAVFGATSPSGAFQRRTGVHTTSAVRRLGNRRFGFRGRLSFGG